MTDRDLDTSVSVTRGMRALLARREAALANGAAPIGWKIGFNTPAIQEHFGLTDAVVGYLTDTGLSRDGTTVSLAGWGAPAVEVEVAVRVGPDGGVGGLAPEPAGGVGANSVSSTTPAISVLVMLPRYG